MQHFLQLYYLSDLTDEVLTKTQEGVLAALSQRSGLVFQSKPERIRLIFQKIARSR
jgi:hypothetical protein